MLKNNAAGLIGKAHLRVAEARDKIALAMVARRAAERDALEFNAFFRENAHIFKAHAGNSLGFFFATGKKGQGLGKHLGGFVIEVVKMKVRRNHGVHVKKSLCRAGKFAVGVAAARSAGFGNAWVGALLGKHGVDKKTHAAVSDDACSAADLLKFHGKSTPFGKI